MRPEHVGCTGGILRRLLCAGLRFRGLDGDGGGGGGGMVEEEGGEAAPAPGVIARLMGLEAMPPAGEETTGKVVGVPCGTGRSRSMSRIESSCWTPATDEAGSARLKKSSSLRETPTFLRPENEDFLLLSFGHDDEEEGEEASASTMIEICLLKLEEKETQGRRAKKAPTRLLKKTMEKEPRTPDSESSSQNSSPVSVLGRDLDSSHSTADRFIDVQEIPVSSYHHSSSSDHRRRNSQRTRFSSSTSATKPDDDPNQQNSRRRRSRARELQIVVRNPTPDVHHCPLTWAVSSPTPAPRGTGSPELCFEIRRLTGEDLRRADWVAHGEWRETRFAEDVGAGVELQVLDLLLRELVDDLRGKRR